MLELEPFGEDTMLSRRRCGFAYVFWPLFASNLINLFDNESLVCGKIVF